MQVALGVLLPERAAVAVAARHQEEAGRAQALAGVQPRQADRAHRLAVEIAVEGDELELAGGGAHDAQAGLDRRRARVVELHAGQLLRRLRPCVISASFSSSCILIGVVKSWAFISSPAARCTASVTFGWQWPSPVT